MSELSQQRTNLLSTQHRLDLDQFFKTKMKLIDDSATSSSSTSSNGTLNTSLSSASSNSILHSQLLAADETVDETPSSVKQVLVGLNETARTYLSENSVERSFQRLNRELLDKAENYCADLERELAGSLRRKYPKFSASIHESSTTNDSARLRSMVNDYMSAMFVQMHNEICEMTYKMSLAMAENLVLQANGQHAKAATQTETGAHKSSHLDAAPNSVVSAVESLGKKIVGGIKLPFVSHSHTTPTISSSSSLAHHQQHVATTPSSELDITMSEATSVSLSTNSKSKRPISAQMYEATTPLVGNVSSSPISQPAKVSLGSSSSNENIIECMASSDDDLDSAGTSHQVSETSSKVSWKEQGGGAPSSTARTPIDSATVPVPAPRKTKSIMKQFLGGLGAAINPNTPKTPNSSVPLSPPQQPATTPVSSGVKNSSTSPKLARKIDTINEESVSGHEPTNSDEVKQLQHLNKDRPKRANIKKPTVKNPQAKIEVEATMENLEEPEKIDFKPDELTISLNVASNQTPSLSASTSADDATKIKQVSPSGIKPLAGNGVEQPKISQNALENVKLRSTVRYKPPTTLVDENSAAAQSGAGRGATAGLANRLSVFEQQKQELQLEKDNKPPVNQFLNVRLKKAPNENSSDPLVEHEPNESSAKSSSAAAALRPITGLNFSAASKQVPPIPPNKPPRPAYNPPTSTTTPSFGKSMLQTDQASSGGGGGNLLVKLRPVSTAINSNNNLSLDNNPPNSSTCINTRNLDDDDDDDFETEYITI